ncbi:exodeoxyribonuclease VII large subunit, partial [Acinetobacter baumannii]
EGAAARLRPVAILNRTARAKDALVALGARNRRAMEGRLGELRQKLLARSGMLQALSHQGVLKRGFAIIRDGTGAMVRRAESIRAGAALG